ncbi:MAG: type II secretion system protein M [Candidatus Omnitrophica bacterium]|nr:type II secretion system protein M [Candidatus Omnitrophota bacterium]
MIRLPKLDKKQKILAIIAFAILFIFLVDRLLLSSLRSKLKNMQQQIKLAEATLKRNLAVQNSKDKLLEDYNNYKPYLKTESVDASQVLAEFLREIERLAKDAGVSVVNLSPEEDPEKLKDVKKYKASLQLEGSLGQMVNFMYKIERSKLLIKLDRLTLMPKDEQASAMKMEASISRVVP